MPDTSFDNGVDRGSVLCRELAHTVLDDYTDRLINMVETSTHGLTIDDIRTFLDRFKESQIQEENAAYKVAFQRCVDRREQEVFGLTRSEPFKRVLTMNFAHMFPPGGRMDTGGSYVSRRVLNGLFLALEKMVGESTFTKGRNICLQALDAARAENGTIIWEDLYTHNAAVDCVDDLLMKLVTYFDKPKKRLDWMLQLINTELGPADRYDFEGPANQGWRLDERNLTLILRNLFRHLRQRLTDKTQAQALAAKYGAERARVLVSTLKNLEQLPA